MIQLARRGAADDPACRPAPLAERGLVLAVVRRSHAVRLPRLRGRGALRRRGVSTVWRIARMTPGRAWRRETLFAWLRRVLIAAAVVAIALQWVNTRIVHLCGRTRIRRTRPCSRPIPRSTRWRPDCVKDASARSTWQRCERYSLLHDPLAPFERLPAGAAAPMGELLRARRRLFVHRRGRTAGVSRRCPTTICARWRCSWWSDAALVVFVVLRLLAMELLARTARGVPVRVERRVLRSGVVRLLLLLGHPSDVLRPGRDDARPIDVRRRQLPG